MPLITDTVAHTFWSHVHLRTVHYEHGKAHVHYELSKAAKDDFKDKHTGKQKLNASEDVCTLPALISYPVLLKYSPAIYADPLLFFPSAYTKPDYLPPRA